MFVTYILPAKDFRESVTTVEQTTVAGGPKWYDTCTLFKNLKMKMFSG